MTTNEKFSLKAKKVKAIWLVLLLLSIIATAIIVWLLLNDVDVVYYEYLNETETYRKVKYIVAIYIISSWDIFCFVFAFCALFGVKYKTYNYDEHEISTYLGFMSAYLIVDNEIKDKYTGSSFSPVYLQCYIGENMVLLTIGAFTLNNYTLKVGDKILH